MLDLSKFHKLYHGTGRCAYHPRMMLKVIVYAYMNNIYSCRKIEKLLHRDIHFSELLTHPPVVLVGLDAGKFMLYCIHHEPRLQTAQLYFDFLGNNKSELTHPLRWSPSN